eukprot:gene5160-10309_t
MISFLNINRVNLSSFYLRVNSKNSGLYRRLFSSLQEGKIASELLRLSNAPNKHKVLSANGQNLNASHISNVLWELVRSSEYADAASVYELLDSPNVATLRSDQSVLASIVIYGGLRKPSKARLQALLIDDKTLSAETARLLIDAYSRSDRLHSAESLMFLWTRLWLKKMDDEMQCNDITKEKVTATKLLLGKLESLPRPSASSVTEKVDVSVQLAALGLDRTVLASTEPDPRAWKAMGRLYAGRHAATNCMSLLEYMLSISPPVLGTMSHGDTKQDHGHVDDRHGTDMTSVSVSVFFHYAIRAVCNAGGTGVRRRVQTLLNKLSSWNQSQSQSLSTGSTVLAEETVAAAADTSSLSSLSPLPIPLPARTLQHLVRRIPTPTAAAIGSVPSFSSSIATTTEMTYTVTGSGSGSNTNTVTSGSGESGLLRAITDCAARDGEERGVKGLVSAVVTRLCQVHRTDEAAVLVAELETLAVPVGPEARDTIIHSFCLQGRWREALQMLGDSGIGTGTGSFLSCHSLTPHRVFEVLRKHDRFEELAELLMTTTQTHAQHQSHKQSGGR